jgi:hypothetical protein
MGTLRIADEDIDKLVINGVGDLDKIIAKGRLDSWKSFIEEIHVPDDLMPAVSSGRAELIKSVQPRALSAEGHRVLLELIGGYMRTNEALRDHAWVLAKLVRNWVHSGLTHLHNTEQRIQRFAHFELENGDDGELDQLSAKGRLDSWNSFIEEIHVPDGLMPVVFKGLVEQIKSVQPRVQSAGEHRVLLELIGGYMRTNEVLRDHCLGSRQDGT